MRRLHRTLDKVDVRRVPVPVSPDFRLTVLGLAASIACLVVSTQGNPSLGHNVALQDQLLAWVGAGGFLVAGVVTVRSLASQIHRILDARTGPGHAGIVRWLILLVGYLLILLVFLDLIAIKAIHQILLGGAITGIVLGIAAQSSLSNLFAGLVLLLARPFAIGDRVRIRSGALGGETVGRITGMGLTYVTLLTDDGPLSLPNNAVLAAGVGPAPPPRDDQNRQRTAGFPSGA